MTRAGKLIDGARRLALPALLCLVLSGCVVAQSYRVSLAPGETDRGLALGKCRSEAGSYALSMTTWKFEVWRYGSGPYVIQDMTEAHYPDTRFTYCLDYLASVISDDKLSVGYTPATAQQGAANAGLLSYVASFAVDRSADIARDLIRTIFVVLSGDPKFGPNRSLLGGEVAASGVKLGAFEVDPLDAEEMAALNARLRAFGFCLVLGDYSFDTSAAGPGAYCTDPQSVSRHRPSPETAALRAQRWVKPVEARAGILYRPRLPYTLYVYTKDDPQGSGAWLLRMTKIVELENLSPVISLGLNRAAFAQARVGLVFDNGVLSNFCIAKTSEVAGFIDVPLDIVYGVVSLPSATIMAEINRANQTAALVSAQKELILAQRKFIEFEKNKSAAKPAANGDAVLINGQTGCAAGGCIGGNPEFPDAVKVQNSKFKGDICAQVSASIKDAEATP